MLALMTCALLAPLALPLPRVTRANRAPQHLTLFALHAQQEVMPLLIMHLHADAAKPVIPMKLAQATR